MIFIGIILHMNLTSVDLNLLVVLRDLLTTRNLTETARRVGRTQPAVSHALKRLRDLFDDELLVRSGNTMVPTSAAEALIAPLEEALSRVDDVLSARGVFVPERLERRFVIGSTDFADLVVLPELLPRLTRSAPGVEITTLMVGDAVEHEMQEGHLDMAFGTGFRPLSGLMLQPLYEERLVCAIRKGHPAVNKRLSEKAYLSLDHVLVTPRGLPGGIVDDRLRAVGKERRVVLRLPSFSAAAILVADTELAVTLPERVALRLARHAPLELFTPPLDLPRFTFGILYNERRKNDPAHRWLRQQVADAVKR
jgi:DNA-binding transcriptional LysR family regulator